MIILLIVLVKSESASQSGMNQDFKYTYQSNYANLLPFYIVDMSFPEYVQIQLQISGCETCTSPYIQGGPDMFIQLNYSVYIQQCDQVWELHGICGTYLEMHKPFDKNIIYEQQIKGNGTLKTYMLTKQLKSGRYEIWIVVRSRIGSIIQYVKPFFITIVNQ